MCSAVALDVCMLSWLDLLLLCTSHTHIHRDFFLAQKRELGARLPLYRCCCTAVVLLYTAFVAAGLSGWFCG